MSTAPITRRILARYEQADAAQLRAGHEWYEKANDLAHRLSDLGSITLAQSAAIIAALSPQVSWDKNIEAATRVVALHAADAFDGTLERYPGYGENVRKCARILAGDIEALRGPKVTAFYHAILGDLSHVVVDVWATRAARSTQANLAHAYLDDELPGARERRDIDAAYRSAARLRDIKPAVMQAIVWTVTRESGEWVRPQTMPHAQRRRFYARQAAARARIGKGMPYDWNGGASPHRNAAYA